MLQRNLRALALAACAMTSTYLAGGTAFGATLHGNGVYGNAVWGNFVGNHTVGGAGRSKVALSGKAPFAGCFDRFQTYFIAARDNTGYSKGDGGDIRISVQSLDTAGNPSGTVLGASTTYSPRLANGWLPSGGTTASVLFPELRFANPPCLSASQRFAVVFENVDPDPANNYLGINTVGVARAANSPALDPIWRTLMQGSSGSWVVRLPSEYHTPIIRLCRNSDGECILQTYMESAGPQRIGGAAQARQILIPSAPVTIRSCKLTLGRASSSATSVRVGIASLSGAYLNGGAAYANISLSALPVASSGYYAQEVTATFPAPVTLTAGAQYALLITSPTSGGVWLGPMRDGVGFFKTVSGFGGTIGRAQYSSGSGWTDWAAKPSADLQFYCQA